jgi:YesN/AraC family two-component response regulator
MPVESDALVIFGISGDLAYKKIFPALQAMVRANRLTVPVVGVSRTPWTVEQLAAEVRLSRSRFSVLFSRVVGESPHTYLTRLRMQRASRLLREHQGSIADVALAAAWADHERAAHESFQTAAWLELHDCEVVVVDLNMPKVDGISLITYIREIQPGLPVIVFTGIGYEEERMHAALRAGANGYVSKHLPIEQLYCVLSRMLATSRQRPGHEARMPARSSLLGAA